MYGLNLIAHLRALRDSANRVGARVKIQFDTLRVEVSRNEAYFELEPTFSSFNANEMWLEHSMSMSREASAFVGWGFRDAIELPIKYDRLAFKKYFQSKSLVTPELIASSDASNITVLVKDIKVLRRGTIDGPMPAGKAYALTRGATDGRYVEQFVDGDPFQAWYAAGQLCCFERRPKPAIVGDGVATVRELIARLLPTTLPLDEHVVPACLELQDLSFDSVLESARSVIVDIRFHSSLQAPDHGLNENSLAKIHGSGLFDDLKRAGAAILDLIPTEKQRQTVFRLDGVVGQDGRASFASIGSDQYTHPDVYGKLLPAMLGVNVGENVPTGAQPQLAQH